MNNYLPSHFISLENNFKFDLLYGFGIKTKLNSINREQISETTSNDNILIGGKPKKEIHKFIDEGGVYTYTVFVDENYDPFTIHIVVVTPQENDCVTVLIDKKEKIAVLHNMSYFEGCAQMESREGLKRPGGGTKLLRFALNLLLELSQRYHFKRILLKDNSFIHCNKCSKTVKLASLRMITHGLTWYGKYGFKPYDPGTSKPSELLKNALNTNNKTLSVLKTKDVNIINIVKDTIKKEKLKNININEIERLIKQYPLFRNFIVRLTKEFDKYCCILVHIMDIVYYTKIKLVDFDGKTFYLDI